MNINSEWGDKPEAASPNDVDPGSSRSASVGDQTQPPQSGHVVPVPQPTALSESAASLASMLANERDLRREERFFWIFGVTMLLDAIVFDSVSSWSGCVAIFVLQLVFLIGIAQWLGIDWVVVLLQRVLGKYLTTDEDK